MTDEYGTSRQKLEKLTWEEKIKNDYQWFKAKAKWVLNNAVGIDLAKAQINYDLVANKLNEVDFQYLTNPFQNPTLKMPARLKNRDIISGKIKVLQGMEMRRPFVWKVIATNPEATTRKEAELAKKIASYTHNSVMGDIEKQIQMSAQQQLQSQMQQLQQQAVQAQGQNPNQDSNTAQTQPDIEQQAQQLQQQSEQQMQQQIEAATPDRVREYMKRDHQDPIEILSNQLLQYLLLEDDVRRKFNNNWFHFMVSGRSVFNTVIKNGTPSVETLNPKKFRVIMSIDSDFFEDAEAAVYEYDWTFNEIVTFFGEELTKEDIDNINNVAYSYSGYGNSNLRIDWNSNRDTKDTSKNIGIPVFRVVWKSLRNIKILTYTDIEAQEEKQIIVDETYRLNLEGGDLEIENLWIPEVYETYIIQRDIYKFMRPVQGQFRDINRLYECKLPFVGGVCDNFNTEGVSIVDRAKEWQYLYNLIWFRIDMLMASDKGKKLLMNINAVPSDSGIDIKQWQEFFETTPYAFFNPNEEGVDGHTDANLVAKVLDMSLASQINEYIKLAQEIKFECGQSLGISPQIEGQVAERDSVYGTKTAVQQSSTLLEPYFNFYDNIKKNTLTRLIELAKVAYENQGDKKLSYILDDGSLTTLTIDENLLSNATFGLYVQNSLEIETIKDNIIQLAHAALQNQQIKLSDLMMLMREQSLPEMEDKLQVAEDKAQKQMQESQQAQQQHEKEMQDLAAQQAEKNFEKEKELLMLKGEIQVKVETAKTAMQAASFNPDEDRDNDGVNDFVELSKKIADTKIKEDQLELEKDKFEHKKEMDKEKMRIEHKKVNVKK